MIWNTGLLTAASCLEIYCIMIRNDVFTNKTSKKDNIEDAGDSIEWRIATFLSADKFSENKAFRHIINNWSTIDIKVTDLPSRLPQATYFSTSFDCARLVYDPEIPLKKTSVSVKHLLHHKEKFPADFNDIDSNKLVECVQNGIEVSLRRAKYNYRLAVPQYFRDKHSRGQGTLQLLLPIKLNCDNRELPEIAVALQLEKNNSQDEKQYYVVKTLFSLDMAYSNARVLQKIDQVWLQAGIKPKTDVNQAPVVVSQQEHVLPAPIYPYMYPAPYYMGGYYPHEHYAHYQYSPMVYYPQHE